MDPIYESLEICAERAGDITATLYERFFAASAEADALMGHSDLQMQGRMLEQTIELFTGGEELMEYFDWELDNHLIGYGVTADMYQAFFAAFTDVVRESCADAWTPEMARAWAAKSAELTEFVAAHRVSTT